MIFDIIKRNDVGYTQNNNGVFLSLSTIPNRVIKEIDEYVDMFLQRMCDRDNNITRGEDKACKEDDEQNHSNEYTISNEVNDGNNRFGDKNEDLEMNIDENDGQDASIQDHDVENGPPEWSDVYNLQSNDACTTRVIKMVDCLEESYENLHKKKGNIKYSNAMKKYGRMYTNDKKFDPDVKNTLTFEPYMFDS